MTRHFVHRADADPADAGAGLAGVGEDTPGAAVTAFDVFSLHPGGRIAPRVQSFEECVYVLSGAPVLQLDRTATLLQAGDFGLIPVGTPHAWFNDDSETARWASMRSPQPRSRFDFDTYPVALDTPPAAIPVDASDPRTRYFGHIELSQMEVGSVSMATALMVYTGIAVKMMVDSNLGARLTTMFMVHYDPDGAAGAHDHPFEETYLFLEGEAEAEFDGTVYRLGPGDLAFAGAGCVHGFRNAGGGPLRWLETQAPQPPSQHSYRFVRDWDYLRSVTGDP
jgi:quercetin dioxygenase-like cupin family protein